MSVGMGDLTGLSGGKPWTSEAISPDRPAVMINDEVISFGQFDADIDAAVGLLRRAGIGPGTTIASYFGGSSPARPYEQWVAHIAAMRLGAVHATIVDPAGLSAFPQPIDAIVGVAPEGSSVPVVAITREALAAVAGDEPLDPATAPDPARGARLNLTSGTTGAAKLVRWDAPMIAARVRQAGAAPFIGPETRLFTHFGSRVTAGFRYPLAVWGAGGCVLMRTRSGATPPAPSFVDRSTLFVCSPFQLARTLAVKNVPWPGRDERIVLTVGGRLPAAVRERALKLAAGRVLIGYGSTETGNIATGDARLTDRHPGAIGRVRTGVTVEIVDARGRPVPSMTVGRLRIKSPLMVGKYENAGGQDQRVGLIDGWFYPGDLGVLFADGVLAIEGRASDIVNIGGIKVAIPAVEEKVRTLPEIADACACLMQLPTGDRLMIAVVCDDDAFTTIGDRVSKALGPVSYPFNVARLPRIPRNDMGKVPRLRLARQLAQHFTPA